MSKLLAVVSCPIDTYSGYGARSRDFVKALIKARPEWDVCILAQRWGVTKFGYLGDHNEAELATKIIAKLDKQPDIWIQITVPNEFQPIGKYNIGVTAGIETTVCHESWIQGVNRMNLVLTSANHAKKVFETTSYEINDNAGNKTGDLKLEKPVEVLFEGVDTSKYFKTSTDSKVEIVKSLDSIKESFCFLIVGHWLQGEFGQDRKNIGVTIERFLSTFKTQHTKPALVIKTQSANSGIMDRAVILEKIDLIRKQVGGSLPNIYLIHGETSDNDMNQLYNHPKIKAMVSFTKGEGFGRPLLEFSTTGKPIIASNWSGHTDFLNPNFTSLVGGKLEDVHSSSVMKDMIIEGSKWFEVDQQEATKVYKYVYKKYKSIAKEAIKQKNYVIKNFSLEKMQEKLDSYLEKYTGNIPVERKLVIPKPKEIKLPKRPKSK